MNITLDDLDYLVINANPEAAVYDFDLESLINFKKNNLYNYSTLYNNVFENLKTIKDEDTRDRVARWTKATIREVIEDNLKFHPEQYIKENTSKDFSNEFIELSGAKKLVSFMTNTFKNFKKSYSDMSPDAGSLFNIVDDAKTMAYNSGIMTLPKEEMIEIVYDPKGEKYEMLGFDETIFYNDYLENNIEMPSLLYFIKKTDEAGKMVYDKVNDAEIYYNESTYNRMYVKENNKTKRI